MNVAFGEQCSFTIFDAFKFKDHLGSCSDIKGQKINYTATKLRVGINIKAKNFRD
jgi:hypothetical protein